MGHTPGSIIGEAQEVQASQKSSAIIEIDHLLLDALITTAMDGWSKANLRENQILRLVDLHAATYEDLPKSTSKAERERGKSTLQSCLTMLDNVQESQGTTLLDRENIINRCKRSLEQINE